MNSVHTEIGFSIWCWCGWWIHNDGPVIDCPSRKKICDMFGIDNSLVLVGGDFNCRNGNKARVNYYCSKKCFFFLKKVSVRTFLHIFCVGIESECGVLFWFGLYMSQSHVCIDSYDKTHCISCLIRIRIGMLQLSYWWYESSVTCVCCVLCYVHSLSDQGEFYTIDQ